VISTDASPVTIVGLSGGKDSAWVAYILCKLKLNILCVFVDTGYQSPIALENANMVCDALGVPLLVLSPAVELFNCVYRQALGSTWCNPIKTFCVPCSEIIHNELIVVAGCVGATDIWLGVTEADGVTLGNRLENDSNSSVQFRQLKSSTSDLTKRHALASMGVLSMKRSSPLKTNCKINWLIISECYRRGIPNPYVQHFAYGSKYPWIWKGFDFFLHIVMKLGYRRRFVKNLMSRVNGKE